MENTLVWCKTKAEVREVLSEAKNMGYHMPDLYDYTERFWSTHESETVINLHGNDKAITYCYKDWYINHPNFGKIITASKFFGRKPILITRKGRVVTAENKNTGEKAIATCSPTDTFDFGTGAMIAVARLISQSDKGITKDAETVIRQLLGDDVSSNAPSDEEPTTKFKVDDLVTLRPDVIPGNVYDGITLRHGEMYNTAFGKPIKVIHYDSGDQTYLCEAEGGSKSWWYSSEMLEAWDENKIHEGDKVYVSSASRNYPYYTEWVYEHITDSDLTKRFGYGGSITDKDKVYEVVKIAPHKDGHPMLAYIRPHVDTIGSCHLIDVDGLKKVTE